DQCVRVSKLRDRLGRDERRRLDLAQPRVDQQLDEAELRIRRDPLGLVLEAVARPDLVDPDVSVVGARAHRGGQTRGGSIARSITAISTSMRSMCAMAATWSGLPHGASFCV